MKYYCTNNACSIETLKIDESQLTSEATCPCCKKAVMSDEDMDALKEEAHHALMEEREMQRFRGNPEDNDSFRNCHDSVSYNDAGEPLGYC